MTTVLESFGLTPAALANLLDKIDTSEQALKTYVNSLTDRQIVGTTCNDNTCIVALMILNQVEDLLPDGLEFRISVGHTTFDIRFYELPIDERQYWFAASNARLTTFGYSRSHGLETFICAFDKFGGPNGDERNVTAGRVRRQIKIIDWEAA